MKAWIDWYDSQHTIYANARHRDIHFRNIAAEIARLVPAPGATVLDYSCGEALSADVVASAAGKLILAEPAPGVRQRIALRFAGNAKIEVRSLDEIAALPDASIDLAVMHSVAQYMTTAEFEAALDFFRRVLKRGGALVIGDVLAPETSAATDALALLRFGFNNGFLIAATVGLVRTLLSSYWRLRSSIGLTRYSETAIVAKLKSHGFSAEHRAVNIGHNPARMTFVCRPSHD